MGIRSLSAASIATGTKRSKFWDQSAQALTSDYELIETIVGDGSSRVISFSSIPSTYKHLAIRGVIRNSNASNTGNTNNCGIVFNDDLNSNYSQHQAYSVNSTTGIGGGGFTAPGAMLNFPGGAGGAGLTGYVIGTINDYASTSKLKVANIRTGGGSDSAGDVFYILRSTMWNNSGQAINKISFPLGTGEWWNSTTAISLYGIKG